METVSIVGTKAHTVVPETDQLRSPASADQIEECRELARVVQQSTDRSSELAAWQRLLTLAPLDPEAHQRSSEILQEFDRVPEAIPHLRALAEVDAEQVKPWKRLAKALAKSGDADGAASAWQRVT